MTAAKKFLFLISSEWFFILFFSFLVILLAFIPVIYQSRDTPAASVFMGTHNNAIDYPMFISEIMQSKRGRWTFLAKYTSEPQPGTLIHIIYLPLGKIAALFNIEPILMYHFGRLLFGLLLSLSIYYFLLQVFPGKKSSGLRKLAFLLVLFSSGFPKIEWTPAPAVKGVYLEWWTGADVFRRATFQPHAMVKNILLILILVWMGKFLSSPKPNLKYLLYSLPSGFILGLLDPMNSLTVFALLGLYSLYKIPVFLKKTPQPAAVSPHISNQNDTPNLLKSRQLEAAKALTETFLKKQTLKSYCLLLLAYFLVAGAALIYLNWIFSHTPWVSVRDWEATQFTVVQFFDYANHLGIIFYLGIPGLLLLYWKKRNIFSYYAFILALAPVFFITSGITQTFHLSLLRFFQTPAYIFLSLGTAYFIFGFLGFFKTKLKTFPFLTLKSLILILIFLPSLPVWFYSLNYQITEYKNHYWNIYPDKSYYDSMVWLRDNTPQDSVVLSNPLGGNLIPAVAGNTVYIGHFVSTVNYSQKEAAVKSFLNGDLDNNNALKYLRQNRIDYLFLSWGEQYRLAEKNYPFLEKLMDNGTAAVYKVNK